MNLQDASLVLSRGEEWLKKHSGAVLSYESPEGDTDDSRKLLKVVSLYGEPDVCLAVCRFLASTASARKVGIHGQ